VYVVKAVTQWMPRWVRDDFRDIKHRDLWERVNALLAQRTAPVKWTHVKGHAGDEGNEAADELAVKGALK